MKDVSFLCITSQIIAESATVIINSITSCLVVISRAYSSLLLAKDQALVTLCGHVLPYLINSFFLTVFSYAAGFSFYLLVLLFLIVELHPYLPQPELLQFSVSKGESCLSQGFRGVFH